MILGKLKWTRLIICQKIMHHDELHLQSNTCQINLKTVLKYKDYLLAMWRKTNFAALKSQKRSQKQY